MKYQEVIDLLVAEIRRLEHVKAADRSRRRLEAKGQAA